MMRDDASGDNEDKSGLECSRFEAIKAVTAHLKDNGAQVDRSPVPSQLYISQMTLHGGPAAR